jgi:hypothetical protein
LIARWPQLGQVIVDSLIILGGAKQTRNEGTNWLSFIFGQKLRAGKIKTLDHQGGKGFNLRASAFVIFPSPVHARDAQV